MTSNIFVKVTEENQTRKILNNCKTFEEAIEKTKTLLKQIKQSLPKI